MNRLDQSRIPSHSRVRQFEYQLKLLLKGILAKSLAIHKIGLSKFISILRAKTPNTRKIALVAIVKNEAKYLREWIAYYQVLGIDKIFIYDNESNDDIKNVLHPFLRTGYVEYIYFPGKNMQEKAYLNCVGEVAGKFDWLVTADIDEFLQPMTSVSLKSWLSTLKENVSQVEFGWMIFGSSGLIHQDTGLVIERFTHHAITNFLADSKPVVRPEKVISMDIPHYYEVVGRTVDENMDPLRYYPVISIVGAQPLPRKIFRFNHYYSKSRDEFFEKSARGDASNAQRQPRNERDFLEHDQNEIQDNSMENLATEVRKILNKLDLLAHSNG